MSRKSELFEAAQASVVVSTMLAELEKLKGPHFPTSTIEQFLRAFALTYGLDVARVKHTASRSAKTEANMEIPESPGKNLTDLVRLVTEARDV